MRHVKTVEPEKEFTIELTESELGTLIAALGCSNDEERDKSARFNGVRKLDSHDAYLLLRQMLRIYRGKDDEE